MCESLLVVDPGKRLGSGAEGSALSFAALKRHEFFKGADFHKVPKTRPPLSPELVERLSEGSNERCFSEFDLPGEIAAYRNGTHDVSSGCEEVKRRKSSLSVENSNEQNSKIVKEGVVDKKCGWVFYYNRKLKLTSEPRLSYYNPKTNEYKVLIHSL